MIKLKMPPKFLHNSLFNFEHENEGFVKNIFTNKMCWTLISGFLVSVLNEVAHFKASFGFLCHRIQFTHCLEKLEKPNKNFDIFISCWRSEGHFYDQLEDACNEKMRVKKRKERVRKSAAENAFELG